MPDRVTEADLARWEVLADPLWKTDKEEGEA